MSSTTGEFRDSLTPAEALAFVNMKDRGKDGRTAVLGSMPPEQRERGLLSIILALREIPAKDRKDVIMGVKPLTPEQLADFNRRAERMAA